MQPPGNCGHGYPAMVPVQGGQKPQAGHQPALPILACPCGVWQSFLFGSIWKMLLFRERLWGTSFLWRTLVLAALPLSPSVPARCLHCHAPFPHQACPRHPSCPFPCVLTSLGVLPWGPVLQQGLWVLLEPCRCQAEAWPHQGTWATAELPGGAGASQGSGDRGTQGMLCSPAPLHCFPSCSQ